MFFRDYFSCVADLTNSVESADLVSLANLIYEVSEGCGKVIVVGNGGSAAMGSHIAVDLTKAAQVRAINFNEADLITCFANDYGYENWIREALLAYGDTNDLLIAISSSGSSLNILNGVDTAKSIGMHVATFSGFSANNALREKGNLNFWVDSHEYNIVEMTHHIWLCSVVDYLASKCNRRIANEET